MAGRATRIFEQLPSVPDLGCLFARAGLEVVEQVELKKIDERRALLDGSEISFFERWLFNRVGGPVQPHSRWRHHRTGVGRDQIRIAQPWPVPSPP